MSANNIRHKCVLTKRASAYPSSPPHLSQRRKIVHTQRFFFVYIFFSPLVQMRNGIVKQINELNCWKIDVFEKQLNQRTLRAKKKKISNYFDDAYGLKMSFLRLNACSTFFIHSINIYCSNIGWPRITNPAVVAAPWSLDELCTSIWKKKWWKSFEMTQNFS